jgi:hypothetical protein
MKRKLIAKELPEVIVVFGKKFIRAAKRTAMGHVVFRGIDGVGEITTADDVFALLAIGGAL